MCVALPLFLAHVFWLVAEANRGAPARPALDTRWLLAGLAVFLVGTMAWVVALHRHFRRQGPVAEMRRLPIRPLGSARSGR